ncbi:hypothetical protein [Nostoc sp.]|uniref:hypothetical protein n=1 Tax=Nostoc sp. TaxID=1180 RepID=UPI002FF52320
MKFEYRLNINDFARVLTTRLVHRKFESLILPLRWRTRPPDAIAFLLISQITIYHPFNHNTPKSSFFSPALHCINVANVTFVLLFRLTYNCLKSSTH